MQTYTADEIRTSRLLSLMMAGYTLEDAERIVDAPEHEDMRCAA